MILYNKGDCNVPSLLFKYLSIERSYDFIKCPNISFAMIKKLIDNHECLCDSIYNCNVTRDIVRSAHVNCNYGVLCLSEDGHSSKMWDEYADKGQGIQIAFNACHSFFELDGAGWSKVKYTEDVPCLPPYEVAITSMEICKQIMSFSMRRKDLNFAFEAEWRTFKIIDDPDALKNGFLKLNIPTNILNEIVKVITLGINIPDDLKELCIKFSKQYDIPLYHCNSYIL